MVLEVDVVFCPDLQLKLTVDGSWPPQLTSSSGAGLETALVRLLPLAFSPARTVLGTGVDLGEARS